MTVMGTLIIDGITFELCKCESETFYLWPPDNNWYGWGKTIDEAVQDARNKMWEQPNEK